MSTEFAVGVAAAAYAINSIEEDEAQHKIKIMRSRQATTTRTRSSDRVTRPYSSNGETSSRNSIIGQDSRRQESSLHTNKPASSFSARPMAMEAGDKRRKGNHSQLNPVETKADAWEKAQIKKLNRRYEDMKASILTWENEKKLRAKVKKERRKKELEERIKRNEQLYRDKISRIDQIAGGARAQVDDRRRNEGLKIKEKARQMRASGKVPVSCFCF